MIKVEVKSTPGALSTKAVLLWFRTLAPWLLGAQIAVCIAVAALSSRPWVMYVRDDFLYYVIVAQNLAAGHGSTYNGIVTTNGYHPLWTLVWTAFSLISTNGTVILVFLGITCLVASLVCYLCAQGILEISGVEATISAPLAVFVAVFCCRKFYTGMEAVLATPLAFVLTHRVMKGKCITTAIASFGTGVLCSLLILSRLDAGFLVGLLGIALLLDRSHRTQICWRTAISFGAGLIPFAAYMAINWLEFGVLLPVSGMAKQLKPHTQFSWVTWKAVLSGVGLLDKERLQIIFILLSTIVILISVRKLGGVAKVVFPAVLLFPVVYFTALSFLSDWVPNDWYMYVERPALCISFAFWFSREPMRHLSRSVVASAIVLAASVLALGVNTWNAQDDHRYEDALALRQFAANHPGIYAMGDYAGEPGYMLGQPIVQTEGLMMDHAFLKRIERQENLIAVLKAYHVRYYIANTRLGYTGCFHAIEPLRGGPASPTMRAEFCQPPVLDLHDPGNDFVVFDLRKDESTVTFEQYQF